MAKSLAADAVELSTLLYERQADGRWLVAGGEDGQGGGVSLMVLTMIPALLIVLGLVIDGGYTAR